MAGRGGACKSGPASRGKPRQCWRSVACALALRPFAAAAVRPAHSALCLVAPSLAPTAAAAAVAPLRQPFPRATAIPYHGSRGLARLRPGRGRQANDVGTRRVACVSPSIHFDRTLECPLCEEPAEPLSTALAGTRASLSALARYGAAFSLPQWAANATRNGPWRWFGQTAAHG